MSCQLRIPPPPRTADARLNIYLEQQHDLLLRFAACVGVEIAHAGASGDFIPQNTGLLKGDILVFDQASLTFKRVAVGANGLVVVADSAQPYGVKWALPENVAYVRHDIGTAVGDLLVWDGSEFVAFPVGADGDTLLYDSGQPLGITTGPGGGGAPVETGLFDVEFADTTSYVEVVVPAAWVTATSYIHVFPVPEATSDHDAQDAVIEGLYGGLILRTPTTSFTVGIHAPTNARGTYKFGFMGVA